MPNQTDMNELAEDFWKTFESRLPCTSRTRARVSEWLFLREASVREKVIDEILVLPEMQEEDTHIPEDNASWYGTVGKNALRHNLVKAIETLKKEK